MSGGVAMCSGTSCLECHHTALSLTSDYCCLPLATEGSVCAVSSQEADTNRVQDH